MAGFGCAAKIRNLKFILGQAKNILIDNIRLVPVNGHHFEIADSSQDKVKSSADILKAILGSDTFEFDND